MGGVTLSGFPYVTPDDHPIDFPAHSLNLAELLETEHNSPAEEGSVWPAANWQDMGSGYTGAFATRHSGMVTIEGAFAIKTALPVTSGTFYVIGYVPAGFRPAHDVNIAGFGILGNAGYAAHRLRVTRTGDLAVFAIATETLPVSHWTSFLATYRWDTNV